MDKKTQILKTTKPFQEMRRQVLRTASAILTLPVISRVANAATGQILAVRTWPADDYTRVTLELNEALTAEHFMLENPGRLVLDIQGLSMSQALNTLISKIRPNDPYISSVRVAQNRADVVRLVFDLKQSVVPQIFTLKPVANYQYRLVLDLYPKVAKDPVNSLQAASADDPLAGILDKIANDKNDAPVPSVKGQLKPNTSVANNTPNLPSRSGNRPILVAIDPGHGGEDPGAIGMRGTREKDIVLSIARRLQLAINSQPNMRAFMTRDSDFFVPLHVRVQKARRVKADLFVSVHADAFTNRSARGTSVFALSRQGASSASARWLANKENNADKIGGIDIASQDRQTASVLLDMSTNAQINDSLKVGHHVLNALSRINGIHSRKVEQAAFAVLKAPDIPSILVETAFISNPEEEAFLRNTSNHGLIANAIATGLKGYLSTNPPLARLG